MQFLVWMITGLLAIPTFTLMHSSFWHSNPLRFSVRVLYQNTKLFLNDYLVLEAREVPADELLAASLRVATAARQEHEREPFLVEAGRELARLLAGDPVRLEGLLWRLENV